SPLMVAVKGGHLVVILLLIQYGALLSTTDNTGKTPLHIAAFMGNDVVVQLLLDMGVAVDARDENGATALHEAMRGH
ncbi:ankyrin repeat protein, partial [Baffinella frigidus]